MPHGIQTALGFFRTGNTQFAAGTTKGLKTDIHSDNRGTIWGVTARIENGADFGKDALARFFGSDVNQG